MILNALTTRRDIPRGKEISILLVTLLRGEGKLEREGAELSRGLLIVVKMAISSHKQGTKANYGRRRLIRVDGRPWPMGGHGFSGANI